MEEIAFESYMVKPNASFCWLQSSDKIECFLLQANIADKMLVILAT